MKRARLSGIIGRSGQCFGIWAAVLVGLGEETAGWAADPPTPEVARRVLAKATTFFHQKVASHGGYVYAYSGDLTLREGEGVAAPDVIWVQPLGTPTVGNAFLDAYGAAKDEKHLKAANDAALALVRGQLQSGGWFYHIEFDQAKRDANAYRFDDQLQQRKDVVTADDRNAPGGWDVWKRRKYKGNLTTLDDDTTQAALRFLMRMDKVLEFKDERIHEAVNYGLASLLNAQYPN